MTYRFRRVLPGALLIFCFAAPVAAAAPAAVTLRVEGASTTIFDGLVTTDGHDVTTASGGTHKCDGTNAGAFPSPVPTPTAALDDAAKANGFTWDGTWYDSFEDFTVDRVAGESFTSSQFWGLVVNGKFSETGGCQTKLEQGDEAVWVFDAFSKSAVLRLTGPGSATTGQALNVKVTDTQTGAPAAGASVGGTTTGSDGVATLTFPTEGIYRLKADRPDAVRSGTLVLCVDPPGAAACTSSDTMGPVLGTGFAASDAELPGRALASRASRSRTILVSWAAQDDAGSGMAHSSVEVSRVDSVAGGAQAAPEWRSLVDKAPVSGVHFRGERGAAYRFRITATDRALNTTTIETVPVLIPVDDRDRALIRFTRGWERVRASSAWGRTVMRAGRSGATARMRFTGTQVALVGRKLPRGGRLRVTIDGRSATLRARGRSAHRSVLWVSRALDPGTHSLRLRSLGGGPVEIDAVAPSP